MVVSFADGAYYTENFGSPPSRIADRLEAELARAYRYLRAECPGIDARVELWFTDRASPDALDPYLVADVVCEMVKSAAASPGGEGVSSVQQGAGPYQATQTFSNPVGDLYLTKKQKRLLGYGGQRAFTVSMAPEQVVDSGWGLL